ncbi:MAG: hypothetical protein A3G33_04660 [Omnitrophica bacterium RIFCSPLOWO2_12_FULL_44_17]|uniref:Carbamoyltransferase n=1 Tax=Candidatus Danuiimicrobium aquiferis TaxID=1801832 RepID=A0A1G1KQW1_9BACT|nr:MAG: hypothetical protein A3B72_10870 [Omnitrophica bacterium RIFCSPHIGHO2_02_FULL_45_28]OGW88091.1 MAG: hypothetical protein A3E74_04390 [Omnitrophica bacterium RIFCSPHIGHO2_12_FULL_44_12]OGW95225.1 MAG: hypothetical protein A3G33_04660 [Omnitrophica bacterium RIFCSPLOWO2_12_FULL_44_17]OGX02322.1 MAG: hypothetical protein A3J12_09985 [Omnitrophica bacterium RIFCSPLOWO2_02_FULL_44_11]
MIILGVNIFHGDAAAVLLKDGKLIAAAEEERFTRIKHYAGFPTYAIRYCLREANIDFNDIDYLAISRDPSAHLASRIWFNLKKAIQNQSLSWATDRLRQVVRLSNIAGLIRKSFNLKSIKAKIHYVEHHLAHVASAFYASGFSEAAVMSIDAFGDFVSTKWGIGSKGKIHIQGEVTYPDSLGIVYTALTQFLGFPNYGDEYKVMALASYGKPVYEKEFQTILKLKANGRFSIGLDCFRHHSEGIEMEWEDGAPELGRIYSDKLIDLLGKPRNPEDPIERRHQDIAASLQFSVENAVYHLLNHLHKKTGMTKLCLAGGVAFNSVANGKICKRTPFCEIFIQPAAGDAGTALGAALYTSHELLHAHQGWRMDHAYWGAKYSARDIQVYLAENGIEFRQLNDEELLPWLAGELAGGKMIGWFQGRMEWGPRALGNRSILIDPRNEVLKDELNRRIKKRETFRPFAPAVLQERANEFFEMDVWGSPFMLEVYPVRKQMREKIPAVTHIDGTARVQTVNHYQNPRFYDLIKKFGEKTGIPVLLNTSFNENEPIVENPGQAIACFKRNALDILILEDCVIEKV